MKIIQFFTATVITAVILAGCGQQKNKKSEESAGDANAVPPIENVAITAGYWKLITLNGVDVSEVAMTDEASLIFFEEDNRVAGSNSCNRVGGFYTLGENGELSFSQLMNTQMACPPNDIEGPFMDMMASTENYSISGNTLMLGSSSSATPLAVFVLDPTKE